MDNLGKIITGLGVLLVVIGLIIWAASDKLSWFGQLPGDIRIERPGFRFVRPHHHHAVAQRRGEFRDLVVWKIFPVNPRTSYVPYGKTTPPRYRVYAVVGNRPHR